MDQSDFGSSDDYAKLCGFGGDWRDQWWHRDYLQLIAKRLELGDCKRMLDVGCGAGHWFCLLSTVLSPDLQIDGVDIEPEFTANERAARFGLKDRFSFTQGKAEELPFADNSFDLLTCQTLLMHLEKPELAIAEMKRVLRPGGKFLFSEPSNLPGTLLAAMSLEDVDFEDTLKLLRCHQLCEQGKRLSGLGDSSIGERLPKLMANAGLRNIDVFQNERCQPLTPPYESEAQQADLAQLGRWRDSDAGFGGQKDLSKRWFELAGGSSEEFETVWAIKKKRDDIYWSAIDAKTHAGTGNTIHYLFSAEK